MAIETSEYVRSMLPRMIRAAGRRVGDADPEDLADLVALKVDLDQAIVTAVRAQRDVYGRSWAEIARALGTTRQAAHKAYGRAS